jgi:predicted nucleotidyltransferase
MLQTLDPKVESRLGLSNQDIAIFCQQWGIQSMALFGSILRDDFSQNSDIDILLTFSPQARQGLLTLARIKSTLEDQIRRPVDIALKEAVETSDNWIRRREILGSAQIIYDQR